MARKRLKKIQLEIELLKQQGEEFIPNRIPSNCWDEILQLNSVFERRKYYERLKRKEDLEEMKKMKKIENRKIFLQRSQILNENPHISYGLRRNSMFMTIRKNTINRFYNTKLATAILFAPKLVIDLGFNEYMSNNEISNCVRQIQTIYKLNKVNKDPFDLYFCNLHENTLIDKKLTAGMASLRTTKCLVNVSAKSYLDIFPKEKLIYLTPNCTNDLMSFDCDNVYIIGGLTDRGHVKPLTMAKAKKEGLRMARLPLDTHLHWKMCEKSLDLDVVVKILLTLKNTKSWIKALEHVPKAMQYGY